MSEDTAAPGAPGRSEPEREARMSDPGVRVPAPIIHAAFLGLGLVLHATDRWPLMDPGIATWIGVAVVACVSAISLQSAYQFARAGTSMLPNSPSRHLITVGPYRYSRNPIYLSLLLIHLGIGIWINSGWVLCSALPCLPILDRWLIGREERYLAQRFGAEYRRYAARVRRWI